MRTSNKNVWPLLDNQKVKQMAQMTKELQKINEALDKAKHDIELSFDTAIFKINNIKLI